MNDTKMVNSKKYNVKIKTKRKPQENNILLDYIIIWLPLIRPHRIIKQSRVYKRSHRKPSTLYSLLNIPLYQYLMPKKTKNIQKQPKQAKPADQPAINQSPAPLTDDVFTSSFKQRLSQFVALTDQVFKLKQTLEGGDFTQEIKERKQRMAIKVEQAASTILKEELKSLEEWISSQQEKTDQDVKKINKAYEETKGNLLATGSFSEEEVKSQLAGVQQKAEQKQKVYEGYGQLLNKFKAIYS